MPSPGSSATNAAPVATFSPPSDDRLAYRRARARLPNILNRIREGRQNGDFEPGEEKILTRKAAVYRQTIQDYRSAR